MNGKYYSQYLLRALDDEELRLDDELSGLVELGGRLRSAVPDVPGLAEDARRRIWNSAVARESAPIPLPRREFHVPRMAWASAAAVAAAALIAVLVVLLVNPGGPVAPQPHEMAVLHVDRGEVTVRDAVGEEREAGAEEVIRDGDVVLADADARGTVKFESGCIMRLQGEAEIGLSTRDGGVVAEVLKGRSYHRVVDGTSYTARSGPVTVTALGTAFTFDVEGKAGRVISVQSSVDIEVDKEGPEDWTTELGEGGVFLFGAEKEPQVKELAREDLDSDWLRWNKSMDERLGLPVGALSLLDEAPGGETAVQPEQPQPPEQGEPEQPAAQPQPAPQPTPPPQPPPPVEKSVSLSASAREGAVDFSWTVSGYAGYQGYKLVRSETNPAPSYPNDWWMYIDGAATSSATDTSVQAGHTYYYRLAVYNAGAVLGYSNAVQVTVPGSVQELSVTLSASAESGKIKLSWSVSGEGTYSGFKVCRSETNSSPAYPGDALTFVDASARSYADTAVASGHTYYYRVGIYKDGAVVKYSNAVKVVFP